ncbi:MAG: hypothetical protein IKU34_02460 [Clostridia bacterium]|nr:hypothetical protein [Clostridia bacterium]
MSAIGHLFSLMLVVAAGLFGGLSETFPTLIMWITEVDDEEAAYDEEDEEACA